MFHLYYKLISFFLFLPTLVQDITKESRMVGTSSVQYLTLLYYISHNSRMCTPMFQPVLAISTCSKYFVDGLRTSILLLYLQNISHKLSPETKNLTNIFDSKLSRS